jgi:hypothetical protein
MPFSVLSHLFHVERARQRINRSPSASGFATPSLGEVQLGSQDEPCLLASNMRGTFLVTRKVGSLARYGFSPCTVDEEWTLVGELARVLWDLSEAHEWGLRCKGVPEAVEALRGSGLEARTLVVPSALAQSVLGQAEAPSDGLVGTVDRMQVLVTNLPENTALVALAPSRAGICVRVGDHIGMLLRPLAFRVVRT